MKNQDDKIAKMHESLKVLLRLTFDEGFAEAALVAAKEANLSYDETLAYIIELIRSTKDIERSSSEMDN